MLKHIVNSHPEQDPKEVHFGMKIIRTCKTSFERQVYESVAIQQEREQHHLLNSRSEYNRCSLPRLSTQLGENEYNKLNKELNNEKQQEELLESKIRNLRKQRNKERLMPVKSENMGTKRRKININNEYITIQEIWGEPGKTEQTTRKAENNHDDQQRTKKIRTNNEPMTPSQNISGQIKLTNIKQVERTKIIPPYEDREGWEEVRDWNKVLREHKESIEREQRILNENLQNKRKKEESWQLYNLCKKYLEENNRSWQKRREQQEEERTKVERLEKARTKMLIARNKQQNKKWNDKIQQGLSILPTETQKQVRDQEIAKEREELRTMKTNLWKLRSKENKLQETEAVKEIKKLENNVEHVTNLLEKEKKRLITREQQIRITIKTERNKNKKQELLAEVWATMRWITEYLENTTREWEQEKEIREQDERTRIESWDKLTRAEKIDKLKGEQNKLETVENNETEQEAEPPEPNQSTKDNQQEENNDEVAQVQQPPVQPILQRPKLRNTTPMKQQSIENFIRIQQTTPSAQRNNNTENKNSKSKTTPKNNKNSPKTTPNNKPAKIKTKKQLKKEEEQKSVNQLRGFWTNFARKQKERREQQAKSVQQNGNKEVMSEYNCQTDASIEVQGGSTEALQRTKVATNVLEVSLENNAGIHSNKSKFKSESFIAGNHQIKPGLED